MRAVGVVKSVRGAVPVFRPARFPGPLPEPAVRLSPQRALHKPQVACQAPWYSLVWIFSTRRPPVERGLPDRRCSPTQPPDLPDFRCWLTGPLRHVRSFPPLGLLRVLRPIPRPWVGNGPAHHRAGLSGGRATGGWFPRSPLDHSFREVPSYIPVASPRLRRRHSPWPPARPLQPGPELTTRLHEQGGRLRATDRPVSTRFEPAPRLTGLQPLVHLRYTF